MSEPTSSDPSAHKIERNLPGKMASRFEPLKDPEHMGKEASAASRLFDLRLMIGSLFVLYGVLLTVYSFFDSRAEIDKAAGIHLNLWLGLSMLVAGLIFFFWAILFPQKPPQAYGTVTQIPRPGSGSR